MQMSQSVHEPNKNHWARKFTKNFYKLQIITIPSNFAVYFDGAPRKRCLSFEFSKNLGRKNLRAAFYRQKHCFHSFGGQRWLAKDTCWSYLIEQEKYSESIFTSRTRVCAIFTLERGSRFFFLAPSWKIINLIVARNSGKENRETDEEEP